MSDNINYNNMPIKKVFISTLAFTLVLSSIPWQSFAREDVLALPAPARLENNSPVILNLEPVDPGSNESESKESDFESIPDINAPIDQQPEELLKEPENLALDEPIDVPYVDRDEKKLASEQLNVDIDTNTGALVYSYPIVVPPGRNGLQPDLRLTYNNQNSDNFNHFGVGWSLNIPSIQRDGKRGVNNLYSRNDFTSSLSGELRPIELDADDTHGLYGSRIEGGGFFKYEYLAADNSWKVTDKQGVIYTFGSANASRQYNPSDSSQIYKWALVEIRDTNDNYVKYEYYQDANDIYPYKIKYTGHDTTDGIFEVEFLREARSDDMENYTTGFKVDTDYRISEIQAKVNGIWVRKYELDYITGDNGQRSMLDDITESGNDGSSTITLPVDNFDYASTSPGWEEDPDFNVPYFYSIYFNPGVHYFYDANGDALDDHIELRQYPPAHEEPYVHLSTGLSNGSGWTFTENWDFPTSTENNLNFSATRFADVNGDNLTDVIIADYYRGIRDIYINNGTDWELDDSYNFPTYFNMNSYGNSIDAGVRLVDLNGDSLVDVVKSIGCGTSLCTGAWLNNGHGWSSTNDFQAPVGFSAPEYVFLQNQDIGVRLADANGDGLVDILRSDWQYNEIYINNGFGWEEAGYNNPVVFKDVLTGTRRITELVDVNQDGLTDIVYISSNGSPIEKLVYINNGPGWSLNPSYQLPAIDNIHIFEGNFAMADINGDGFIDIMQNRDSDSIYGDDVKKVFINTGNKLLLETVNSSQGARIDLTYKRSNQYRDVSGDLLSPSLPYALETVEGITIDDGFDNDISTTYSYEGGERYYDGAYESRYAGFAEVAKINGAQKTVTYFHQGNDTNSSQGENNDSYYKIGKPYRAEVYDDTTETLLKQNLTKWEENLNEPEVQAKSMVADPSIVALWTFNGSAGSTEKVDNIVGGPNLNEINNPISVIGDDFDPDGAYNLNRYYERYLKAGDNSILDLDYDFTLDALIKFNNTPQQDYVAPIVSKDRTDFPGRLQYIIGYRDDTSGAGNRGVYVQLVGDGGYAHSDLWSWEPVIGDWYYVAFVFDKTAGSVEVYINGVSLGKKFGYAGSIIDYAGDFYVGAHRGSNYNNYLYWNDDIDEIRISDKIRSPQEIADYSHIISNERKFVYDTQGVTTDLTDTTKSTAVQKEYNFVDGNLEMEHSLGEVEINLGTGVITSQIAGDEKDTEYLYANNETKHILAAPKTKIISDTADSKQQDLYYDEMAYGQVNKVNLTKEDYIQEDVEINRKFNSYGLVYEQSDPKFATTTISYDTNNLYPISSEDPLGYVTLTEYDPVFGQIASSTDPNGLVTNNSYDALGRLKEVKISNPDNPSQLVTKQQITYYDTNLPRYSELKDYFTTSNYTTSREYYDGLDRIIQKKIQTDNASEWSTVDINYDEQGRVERESLPYYTSSVSYSSADLNQPAKTYTYDAAGRITTETTPVGATTYHYDGFTTIITDANGDRKDLSKDAYGNLVEVKEYTVTPDFEFEVDVDTAALWHMNGPVASASKKDNEEGTPQYDLTENNVPTDASGFNGLLNGAYEFDGTDEYVSFVNNQGGYLYGTASTIEAWVYINQLTGERQTIYEDWDITPSYLLSFYIDTNGKLRAERNYASTNSEAIGGTTLPTGEWLYIAAVFEENEPTKVYINGQLDGTAPNSASSPNMSSSNGVHIGAWQYNSSMYYYLDGRIDEIRVSDVARTQVEMQEYYEAYLAPYSKNSVGEYLTTTYEYTLTNKLEKITDSQGNIRNFHYDELDNLDWQDMVHKSTVVSPDKINYTHDKNGNVLTEASFKGDAISYVYDNLNRVTYEKLSGVDQISYTYDQGSYGKGQLTFADYGGNNKKYYNYDIFGRLVNSTTTIENENFSMDFEYNLSGDVTKIVYPNDWQVIYNYNSVGQVDEVQLDKGAGPITLVENIEYNANGQMTHFERSNGVDTTYTYDPDQNYRLTDLETTDGVDMLQDLNYSYDSVGNITQINDDSDTDLAKVVWYDYDDLNRLASSTVNYLGHPADNYSRQYQYDEVGNMTYHSELGTMNYDNDNPHQLSGYGTRTFVYDDAGNMTHNGGFAKFAWDHRSRLKSTYDIASEDSTYYKYDHNNQRFIKYTERYVWVPPDIEDPYVEMRAMTSKVGGGGYYELRRVKEDKYVDGYFEKNLGDHTRTHINLGSMKIATAKDTSDPYFILSDHLNSSTIITDNSGNVAEISDYAPYGTEAYSDVTQDVGDDYTFTGQEYDEENNTQYFGARYMDNEIGRFLSVDPATLILHDGQELKEITNGDLQKLLSNPQNLNSYSYSINNPVIYVDPDGNFLETFLDVGFVTYDSGNTLYKGGQFIGSLFSGNLQQASDASEAFLGSFVDLGTDTAAMFIPFVPAGLTKVDDAAKLANKAKNFDAVAQQSKMLKGIENSKAINTLKSVFKTSDTIPGGTMGALRNEIMTGNKTKGIFHTKKAENVINNIRNVFKTENLNKIESSRLQGISNSLKSLIKNIKY